MVHLEHDYIFFLARTNGQWQRLTSDVPTGKGWLKEHLKLEGYLYEGTFYVVSYGELEKTFNYAWLLEHGYIPNGVTK